MTSTTEKFQQLYDVCRTALSLSYVKALGAFVFASMHFLFDGIDAKGFSLLMILTVFDFITACIAIRANPKVMFRSKQMARTPMKWVVYLTLFLSAHFGEKAIAPLGIPLSSMIDESVLGALVMGELHSIIENCSKAGYVKATQLLQVISKVDKYEH